MKLSSLPPSVLVGLDDLVEDASGTRLEVSTTNPDLGRVLVATRSFEVGDIVFRETPVMIWKNSNWEDAISKFQALSDKHQKDILDMHYPSLNRAFCLDHKLRAVMAAACNRDLDPELLFKLMAIAEINAHTYHGSVGNVYTEVCHQPDPKVALFLWGSKVAHSCEPNLSYSSLNSDGKMELKVIRAIQEGDLLTISYTGSLFESSIIDRRAELFHTKVFLCGCSRCTGLDYCRQVRCPNCTKIACCRVGLVLSQTVWICSGCGPWSDALVVMMECTENLLKNDIRIITKRAMLAPLSANCEIEIDRFLNHSSQALSPVHHLTLEALRLKAKVNTANKEEGDDGPTCCCFVVVGVVVVVVVVVLVLHGLPMDMTACCL